MVTYKLCKGCMTEYPATSTFFSGNGKGKLKAKCRTCTRKYNREKQREARTQVSQSISDVVADAVSIDTSTFTQTFTRTNGNRVVTFLNSYPREIRSKPTMLGYKSSLANIS